MDCQHCQGLMPDCAWGELTPQQVTRLETHRASCDACEDAWRDLRADLEAVAAGLLDAAEPTDGRSALLQRFDLAIAARPSVPVWQRSVPAWQAAVAASLLAALLWAVGSAPESPPQTSLHASDLLYDGSELLSAPSDHL